MKILILLFDHVDLLDAGGPYEVFLTASRLLQRDGLPAIFDVATASLTGASVRAYGGLQLTPDVTFSDTHDTDVLIVPGTTNVDAVLTDGQLIEALRSHSSTHLAKENEPPKTVVASVCTGAFFLADAGLLIDRCWTTHWEDIEQLSKRANVGQAVADVRWVDTGAIVTSAGLSSGIAMALHLVDRLASTELAERTAHQIGFPWSPEDGISTKAD